MHYSVLRPARELSVRKKLTWFVIKAHKKYSIQLQIACKTHDFDASSGQDLTAAEQRELRILTSIHPYQVMCKYTYHYIAVAPVTENAAI